MENIIGRKLNLLPAASMSWFPTKKLLTKGVRRKRPGESLSQILSSSIIGSEVAESISKMALVLFHYRLESTHMCGRLFGNSNQLHMDCGRIKPRKPLRG